jgi:hypothetical protein
MAESVWFWLAMLFAGVIGVLLTSFAFHTIRSRKYHR